MGLVSTCIITPVAIIPQMGYERSILSISSISSNDSIGIDHGRLVISISSITCIVSSILCCVRAVLVYRLHGASKRNQVAKGRNDLEGSRNR